MNRKTVNNVLKPSMEDGWVDRLVDDYGENEPWGISTAQSRWPRICGMDTQRSRR